MKITRKQFEKAQKDLPKLQQAQDAIRHWQEGVKSLGAAIEHMDVLEVEFDDGQYTTRCKRKEVRSVPGEGRGKQIGA